MWENFMGEFWGKDKSFSKQRMKERCVGVHNKHRAWTISIVQWGGNHSIGIASIDEAAATMHLLKFIFLAWVLLLHKYVSRALQ